MSSTTILAEVSAVHNLTFDVKEISFNYLQPKKIIFKAGHFILVKVDDGQSPSIKRAYSIASNPSITDGLALCIKIVPGGRGSTYLFNLKPGDKVKLLGPFGNFLFNPPKNNSILLAGTGVGIAPLKSMLHHLTLKDPNRKTNFYFGVRYLEDLFYEKEIKEFCHQMPNLSCAIAISRPIENCPYQKGRLTEILEKDNLENPQNCEAYLCGSPDVVESLIEKVKKLGVPNKQIHWEKM